jgi:hypothetical protein
VGLYRYVLPRRECLSVLKWMSNVWRLVWVEILVWCDELHECLLDFEGVITVFNKRNGH